MYVLSIGVWFSKLFKHFFFGVDKMIYNFIPKIYDLLIAIARTSPLSQSDIYEMANRVYELLAVFMVFKVTISLITYVVNPDDFSDKSKGVSKLGLNIIITLGLLILTPYIFRGAYSLQTIILEDNSLATLIFGKSNSDESNFFNTAGDRMAFMTLSPFFVPNTSIDQLVSCVQLVDENGDINSECFGYNFDGKTFTESSSSGMRSLINDDGLSETTIKNYIAGYKYQNIGLFFRLEAVYSTYTSNNEDYFVFDYSYIISTAVGVIVLLILITFCMDVALRSVKLAFLQLIAPIPILSYVDPKSGKDGMFKKWYQMCFKTFLSLFIRLLALYFGIYIISKVDNITDIIDGTVVTNGLIKIFIVIGVLMFVKQFPKLLESLGIKLDGDGKFYLNPLKKFEEQAAGGKNITGAAAGALVGTMGALSGAGLGRGISGAWNGLTSGKGWKESRKAETARNAEMRRAIASGSTFLGRREAQLSGYLGLPGMHGAIEHDKIETQNNIDNLKADEKKIADKIAPKKTIISKQQSVKSSIDNMENYVTGLIEGGKAKAFSDKYKQLGTDYQYLTNNVGEFADHDIFDAEGNKIIAAGTKITGSDALKLDGEQAKYSKKIGRKELMDQMLAGVHTSVSKSDLENFTAQKNSYDKQVEILNQEIKNYNSTKSSDDISIATIDSKATFDKIHEQAGDIGTSTINIQTDIDSELNEIDKIKRNIESEQIKLEEYSAKEKRIKSNIEATHSQEGGPSFPNTIVPPDSTISRRNGGPGSGTGPSGHGGPVGP